MKSKKRLLVVGGHGSGEIAMSVFETVNKITNEWIIEGFLTDIGNPGDKLWKYPIIGNTQEIKNFVNKGYYIHYTLHFNAKKKRERIEKLLSLEIPLEAHASAIHPLAHINPSTKIGKGVVLLPYAATSFGAEIENFVHIYTSGFVGHNSKIENYSTVAAHSVIGGRNVIKKGAHIGLNSTTREDVQIGEYSIIGMGSVVLKSVGDYSIVAGNPAKFIKKV